MSISKNCQCRSSVSATKPNELLLNKPPRCYTQAQRSFPAFISEIVFNTRTLTYIVVVLTAAVARKALSVPYDFSWIAAFAAG
jgi:hypothetical protein